MHTLTRSTRALVLIAVASLPMAGLLVSCGEEPRHYASKSISMEPYLEDYPVDISFDYPPTWKVQSPATGTGLYAIAEKTSDKGASAAMRLSPLRVAPQHDPAATLALVRLRADELSRNLQKSSAGYEKISEGETTFNGMRAYEVLERVPAKGAPATPWFARTLLILPTDTTEGLVVTLSAADGTDGIHDAKEIGSKGELAEIAKSLRMHATFAKGDTMRTFTGRAEKTVSDLAGSFCDFSFNYPRSWELLTSAYNPTSMVTVRRTIRREDRPDFLGDLLTATCTKLHEQTGEEVSIAALASVAEKGMLMETPNLTRVDEGEVAVFGRKGYQIFSLVGFQSPVASGVEFYLRTIAIPVEADRALIVMMMSTSLSPGIAGPEDLGEKGELGQVFHSLKIGK